MVLPRVWLLSTAARRDASGGLARALLMQAALHPLTAGDR